MTTKATSKRKTTSTTRRATTTSRSATKSSDGATTAPAEKAAPGAEAMPEGTWTDAPEEALEPLKKRDLINAVVARSGVKKRDAKPAVEAALAILGETLAERRPLNLPPFGKAKVTRIKEIGEGRMIVTRLRQKDHQKQPPKDPLAEAAE